MCFIITSGSNVISFRQINQATSVNYYLSDNIITVSENIKQIATTSECGMITTTAFLQSVDTIFDLTGKIIFEAVKFTYRGQEINAITAKFSSVN